MFKNVHYVSADRMGARLYYDKFGALDTKTGCHGEYFLNILARNPEIKTSLSRSGKAKGLLDVCQEWLDYIFDGAAISVKEAASTLELEMSPLNGEKLHKSVNVGFGYSYILALLVTALIAEKEEMVIFENPEAHLHPRGQAVLMELISKAVAHGVQIIIESHSDHIINGSLVAVNKKWITPDLLSIYYFEREEHGHTALSHHLQISETGRITRPPKGFFDQIDIDLRTLTGF